MVLYVVGLVALIQHVQYAALYSEILPRNAEQDAEDATLSRDPAFVREYEDRRRVCMVGETYSNRV